MISQNTRSNQIISRSYAIYGSVAHTIKIVSSIQTQKYHPRASFYYWRKKWIIEFL